MERYWQKEPLLIRQLVPQLVDPLTPEELAGCACEELVESRVITEFETENYALRNGPFEENDFTSLPSTRWTLLVQAMEALHLSVLDEHAGSLGISHGGELGGGHDSRRLS